MNIARLSKLVFGLAMVAVAAAAGAWPDKPLRVIVPAAPGSAPDVAMRLVGNKIGQLLGQNVVVDNRVGAGGVVAMQAFQAVKDDHTFLFAITSTSSIAPLTIRSAVSFDYIRDVQPVVRLAQTPLMIVASPQSGLKSLADVLKAARDKPGALVFATPSQSTLGNLSAAWITQVTGASFNVVPFSRPAGSVAAVVNGDASVFIDGISVVLPLVRSHRLQPVAVLSGTQLPGLEEFPLGRDAVPGLEVVGRFGLVANNDMPRQVVDKMAGAAVAALADPEVAAKLTELGLYPLPGNAAEYKATLLAEAELWGKVVRSAGIKPE